MNYIECYRLLKRAAEATESQVDPQQFGVSGSIVDFNNKLAALLLLRRKRQQEAERRRNANEGKKEGDNADE